jgi:hypothetical protein
LPPPGKKPNEAILRNEYTEVGPCEISSPPADILVKNNMRNISAGVIVLHGYKIMAQISITFGGQR